jgi:hypothetical protein
MRYRKYLTESSLQVKITKKQAEEIEMFYETMVDRGDFVITKKGASYYLSGDLKTLAKYIEDDYHMEYGIESVSKAVKRSMLALGNRLK